MPSGPAIDTFDQIVGRVLLHCELAGEPLARVWVDNAFREIGEYRPWSWKVRRGQFLIPTVYNTGTMTVTTGSDTVTGIGTVWDSSLEGRQFRAGNPPLYTVKKVFSTTSLQLDLPWAAASLTSSGYEIYQCLFTAPADFFSFISVLNPTAGFQMGWGVEARELDQKDSQRKSAGLPYLVASADYTLDGAGTVGAVVHAIGTGASPSSSGIYTGVNDSVFIVQYISTSGGNQLFQWKKDGGVFTSIATPDDGTPVDLQDGVQVVFPVGLGYHSSDVFVIPCSATPVPGLPRFEIWPHSRVATAVPFLYECRVPDLSDMGAPPRYITGNVLLEGALAKCARWPGRGENEVNPYFQVALAQAHENGFTGKMTKLADQDDQVYPADVTYYQSVPFSPQWSAEWLQRKDY